MIYMIGGTIFLLVAFLVTLLVRIEVIFNHRGKILDRPDGLSLLSHLPKFDQMLWRIDKYWTYKSVLLEALTHKETHPPTPEDKMYEKINEMVSDYERAMAELEACVKVIPE